MWENWLCLWIFIAVFVWLFVGFCVAGYENAKGELTEGRHLFMCAIIGFFSLAFLLGSICYKKRLPKNSDKAL